MSADGALDPRSLLLDNDGDGFADALAGPVWLGTADVDAAVAAAAHLLGALAARSLTLPVTTATWETTTPALFLGPSPPAHAPGVQFRHDEDGLLLAAPDGAALRDAARRLAAGWATAHEAPEADASAASAESEPREPGRGRLSLGTALAGGGLYSGAPEQPRRFIATFRAEGGAPEAVEVAARLATEGLAPAVPLGPSGAGAPSAPQVTVRLDGALEADAWEIRVPRRRPSGGLEVVGGSPPALAQACRTFARSFPRLPDGTSLDELEPTLRRYLQQATRDGRLAAAAALRASDDVVALRLPDPGPGAARRLGAPVHNGARSGHRRTWSTRVAWEGERLLDAAWKLALPEGAYAIEAYASEERTVRNRLAAELGARLRARGRGPATVVVRSAYKPALHWLIEEVAPDLPPDTATLSISVGRQPADAGAPDRWLRELYPVAELLEAFRPGLHVELALRPSVGSPSYDVVAHDRAGAELGRWALTPPITTSPRVRGEAAVTPTGAIRAVVDGSVIDERIVPTDREAAWSFLAGEVFPALVGAARDREPPFFHEVAVVVQVSEPDTEIGLDHERSSVVEGLHEDIYFGLLEAFGASRPEVPARELAPARILPFVRASAGGPTVVSVTARDRGDDRVTARTRDGGLRHAVPLEADVRATRWTGRGHRTTALRLEIDGPDAGAALERLAWGARAGLASLPRGVRLELRAGRRRRTVGPLPPLPDPGLAPLPSRPLHPHEVARHARAWAGADPRLHLRVAHESALGQPLVALEVGHPSGPQVSRARRAAWKPTVLVSARQHANEPTSTPAVLELLRSELARPRFTVGLNLVVHPLENPDGARLHAALCSGSPAHMHHAARYTAFGADLQTDPHVDGRLLGESALRHDARRRWAPIVHLNNHGYPAHEWVRPQTGYLPAGFETWSLPVGHLTILSLRLDDEEAAERILATLRRHVADALDAAPSVAVRTRAQVARSARYRATSSTPFRFERGLPFWETARHTARPEDPPLVVITEVPDETVRGALWDACVLAHQLIDEAVLVALSRTQTGDADPLALLVREHHGRR